MRDKQTDANRIGAGKPGPGRPVGSANQTTRMIKEAILEAAEAVGEDGAGRGGLVGYLTRIAKEEPKAFCGLLGKVLPMQITGKDGGPVEAVTQITRVILAAPALDENGRALKLNQRISEDA